MRVDLGQTEAALSAFTEAIQRARASGEQVRLIRALEGCARCYATIDADAAVRIASACDRQRTTLGTVAWPTERHYLDRLLAGARRVLGHAAYQRVWNDGQASTLVQAVSLAEALTTPLPAVTAANTPLSPRERELTLLLARGLTNKQIAAELVVTTATARSHVEHILTKLDLRSRAQIAVWASQHGMLEAPSRP
jgi:DNA-binding CsgD family transcriptional regulator